MTPPPGNPDVVARLDEWSLTYDDEYAHRPETKDEDNLVIDWLLNAIPVGASVLDVGSGTGWLLDRVGWPRGLYRGFDISNGMVERAAGKHPGYRFYLGDALDPWPDYPSDWREGTYRAAVCLWSVLNHISPPELPLFFKRFTDTPGDILVTLARTSSAPGLVSTLNHEELLSGIVWGHDLPDLFEASAAAGLEVADARGLLYGGHPSTPTEAHYLWVTYTRSR